MSKSLVDTCIYETYWSIKLLPHANSTDIIDISKSIEFYRYRDIGTDTDINIGASLLCNTLVKGQSVFRRLNVCYRNFLLCIVELELINTVTNYIKLVKGCVLS